MSLHFRRIKMSRQVLSAVCSLWLLLASNVASADTTDKLNIFVSVLPQKYIAERITGDSAQVSTMVLPGDSPATYEPNPRQISKLSKADLYVRVGVAFENSWMDRIRAVNTVMPVLDAREGLELLELADHDHGHHEEHGSDHDATEQNEASEKDPHIWTSPRVAKTMAIQLTEQLTALRPAQQTLFKDNLATLLTELDQLDKELTELFETTKQRKFMVFHPSWGYFAEAYGLTQLPIEADGKEPGAKALLALIRQARKEGVKTIFIQPQFDKRMAAQIAKAIDGNVVSIDPLSEDYLDNLRKTAHIIAGVKSE
uniref:High-affinity zinc uptake system protein ZnuA n=1 Tax=uncultured Thiotrichaceae bacterium TaxID=298394 RepID=A0A6S6U7M5_9GAMM|nr:MAG: Zinc ABC transporter, periplasmic-binding protein ZnuA [uncultured Thiotrichaceae bacterium]